MKHTITNILLLSAVAVALGACASKKPASQATASIEDRNAAAASSQSDAGKAGKDDVVARTMDDDGSGDVAGRRRRVRSFLIWTSTPSRPHTSR